MAYYEELIPASLDFVPFLLKSDTLTGGRNIAVHRYPNQTRTFCQDMGGNLREFDIVAVIAEPNFFIKRLAFQKVLDKEGSVTLQHPYHGDVRCCVQRPYKIIQEDTSIGEADFEIHFIETFDDVFPSIAGQSISGISNAAQTILALSDGELNDNMITGQIDAKNIVAKLIDLSRLMNLTLPMPLEIDQDNYQTLYTDLDDYNEAVNESAHNSFVLSSNVLDILESYSLIGSTPEYQYNLNSEIFEQYGIDDNEIFGNTIQLNTANQNRQTLNSNIKGIMFVYMLLEAMKIQYKNTDDLQGIINDLNSKFDELSNINNFKESTWSQYIQIYTRTMKYLSDLNISRIVTKEIPRMPLTVFLYDYYENFNNEDEIIKLNNIANSNILKGTIRMLTTEVK